MKKSEAIKNFDILYDSTYNDAIAFIAGKTGSLDNVEKILSVTYSEMYRYFLKCNSCSKNEIEITFLKALKESMKNYLPQEKDDFCIDSKIRKTQKSVDKLLETDFDISETDFLESKLNKKIYSFVMNKHITKRKIFILYFYCNYNAKQIANLLETEDDTVTHILFTLLKEIRDSFLKTSILKSEDNN